LYLRTLHLNNQIDYGKQQQRFPYQREANERLAASVLPTVRHEMQEKAERHQGKHFPITPLSIAGKSPGTKSRKIFPSTYPAKREKSGFAEKNIPQKPDKMET